MKTSDIVRLPIGKISMIGIWVETVLYGVNCAMYGLCLFVLLRRRKTAPLGWVLLIISTILFILCTIHVGASLRQLLEGFIYAPADVPDYIIAYWFDFTTTSRMLKSFTYATLMLAQHSILIWRLYVVYMQDWRIIVLPVLLMVGCVGSGYAISIVSTLPNRGEPASSSLLLSAWVLGFTLNVSATLAIAGRLWWMGRRIGSLTTISTNRFTSSVYLVIESGMITAILSTVVLAFYANLAALSGLDVGSQLIALAPLLVIVQVGLTSGSHISNVVCSKTVPTVHDEIRFQVGSFGEEEEAAP